MPTHDVLWTSRITPHKVLCCRCGRQLTRVVCPNHRERSIFETSTHGSPGLIYDKFGLGGCLERVWGTRTCVTLHLAARAVANWPEMGPACGIRPAAELRSWGSTRAQPGCVRSKKNTHRHHAHRRRLRVREQKVEPNCALPVPKPDLFHGASKPALFFSCSNPSSARFWGA